MKQLWNAQVLMEDERKEGKTRRTTRSKAAVWIFVPEPFCSLYFETPRMCVVSAPLSGRSSGSLSSTHFRMKLRNLKLGCDV